MKLKVANYFMHSLKLLHWQKFLLFVVGVFLTASYFLKGRIPHVDFNSGKWKAASVENELNSSLRWDMMNSLRNNEKLLGKTKGEIVDLLGKPELVTSTEYKYHLGYSKRGINTGTFTLKFDSTGKVIHFQVREG